MALPASVRNGTSAFRSGTYDGRVPHRKGKKASAKATRASVAIEMAKPRTARSARIMAQNLDMERIREEPSATMRGIVLKIFPSPRPRHPGRAQIAVERTDRGHHDLRIENTLTDENGDDVMLKKGDRVEVTIAAESEMPPSIKNKSGQGTRRTKTDFSSRRN